MSNTENIILPQDKPKSPILAKMLELLTDINLTTHDVDDKLMQEFPELIEEGWKHGSTMSKLKMYPILARTAAESRMMLWRQLGVSKIDAYKVIKDALLADKVLATGEREPDHKIRMDASEKFLALNGESTAPAGAKVNLTISGKDSKILIVSSDGGPLPFPMRDKPIPEKETDG